MNVHHNKILPAAEVFNKNALLYEEKFMNVDAYSEWLEIFCSAINKVDADILDVACGPGNIIRQILNEHTNYHVLGIDLAPAMLQLAIKNNPAAQFLEMDSRNILQLNRKFDGIICSFIFPYLTPGEAEKFIADASQLLQIGGCIYISTMEGDEYLSGVQTSSTGDQLFMYYHQGHVIADILVKNGFKILNITRINQMSTNGKLVPEVIIIALKAN